MNFPPKKGIVELSAEQAYEEAGYGPDDMDIVQAYDTMAPSELWELEKLGFCKKGMARELLRDGYFDLTGKLPVNTDGGLCPEVIHWVQPELHRLPKLRCSYEEKPGSDR
ncbi:hypothetical protein KKI24_11460 [bacterium]|nr:hypothetical protein [bacterium]